MIARLRRIARDERAATIVEFAAIVPVMLLMIMALGDLSFREYMQSVLAGAIQKAGRDSSIQGNESRGSVIDQQVMTQIWSVLPAATYVSSRKSYANFGYIAPEPFVDGNGNGIHDTHECFTDVNGNGVWDADPGLSGQGGASDVDVYSISVSFQRLFPLFGFLGWSSTQTISATTILKNQPYATQNIPTVKQICP